MANNKMLIDASHPEETRVVVLRGNRIEEFDFESANKKPLRGNIYLAKVTRVEPSLQAAFVEYGGNRHGFLAFSEIHPDYYQIPVADRIALLEEEAREQREEAAEEENRSNRRSRRRRSPRPARRSSGDDDTLAADAPGAGDDHGNDRQPGDDSNTDDHNAEASHDGEGFSETALVASSADHPEAFITGGEDAHPSAPTTEGSGPQVEASPSHEPVTTDISTAAQEAAPAPAEVAPSENAPAQEAGDSAAVAGDLAEAPARDENEGFIAPGEHGDADESDSEDEEDEEENVEQLGGDAEEDMPRAARRSRRQYKIQEVIKRRQIMLIQVVKEERGNKGAALTTYLSLAGRYSVLMPNTARGGGISRKITDGDDRRRMKEIAQELEVPDGMGVILRTAGASRNKQEIRRDFEYLLRLWESVREMTLQSTAPALVYEEGSLIKRSIRDLYGKEVDEVVVAGDEGHREARDFMRMLMPSHTKNVKQWRELQPIFAKSGVEQQLDSLFSPTVTMKSGGYIVINQTEALVAIDVNSGRSTREHNIEDTALRTNMEAADEIARQLRLRDLAGLIVVDFIDMEEHRNNRSVERRLKEALKNDRARIQVGRISHFGLLEMSRQRMRTGVLEGSSIVCAHCQGTGTVRSTASIALHVLRLIEDALIRNNAYNLTVKTRSEVALYILNQKRSHVTELEQRFGVALIIDADDSMTGTTYHAIERGEPATAPVANPSQALQFSSPADADAENDDAGQEAETEIAADEETQGSEADEAEGNNEEGAPRRRRRRRRGRDRTSSGIHPEAPQPSDDGLAFMAGAQGLPAGGSAEPAEAQNGDRADSQGTEGDEETSSRDPRSRRGFRRRRRGGGGRDDNSGASEPAEFADLDADLPAASRRPGSWVKSADDASEQEGAAEQAGSAVQEDTRPAPQEANLERKQDAPVADAVVETQPAPASAPEAEEPVTAQPKAIAETPLEAPVVEEVRRAPPPEPLPEAEPPSVKRSGWWSRPK